LTQSIDRRAWKPTRWDRRVCSGLAIVASTLLLAPSLSGCYVKGPGFQKEALELATAMHQKMATGDLAGIYNGADQGYRDAVTREKSDALFASIAHKLGAPLDCTQGNTNFNFNTSGTTIVSSCSTHFSKNASGTETFTWAKSGDQFRLLGYRISSDELIER
jgi:hypothetical protein